jgi:hypothetical protein
MNEIYWITRLDGIQAFFAICTILVIFAIVILLINILMSNCEDEKNKSQKWLKKLFCSLPFFILSSSSPQQRTRCSYTGLAARLIMSRGTIRQGSCRKKPSWLWTSILMN